MAFGQTLWLMALGMCLLVLTSLFAWTLYSHFTRVLLPPGLEQRGKLHVLTLLSNWGLGLALIVEKLGICHKYVIWRIMFDIFPPWKDSKLLIQDLVFEKVPVRMYHPKTPCAGLRRAMIYLHGGVGLFGSIQSHERICRFIARESDTVVMSIGYRLAPEHPHPIPVEDGRTAVIYFLKNAKDYGVDPDRISIGGDSSGGTCAAGACQEFTTRVDLPKFRSQILLYPPLQMMDCNLPSFQQNQSVPVLFKKRAIKLGLSYIGVEIKDLDAVMRGAHIPDNLRGKFRKWISADHVPEEFKVRGYVPVVTAPFSEELYEKLKPAFDTMFSPLIAEDAIIRQLPEAFLLTCEYDVFRDDGLLYKKRLEDNGIPVTWYHDKHGFHAICSSIDLGMFEFPSVRNSMKALIRFLERL